VGTTPRHVYFILKLVMMHSNMAPPVLVH
jgi:hypothetical protein